MRILVTGAGGYIGPVLLDLLGKSGVEIKTCDIGWFANSSVKTGRWLRPDFNDFTKIPTAELSSVDAVIHLAAYSNDPLGQINPDETMRLNCVETINFAERARTAGVGVFVFASSCSVYGDAGDIMADEDRTPTPLTPYASSKVCAEAALLTLQTDRFRVAILRGATAFGASPVPRVDLLLNEFCAEAALRRTAILLSTGESWRPFMPISDFARSLSIAARHMPVALESRPVWNIAPPTMQRSVKAAAELAATVADLPPPVTLAGAAADARSYRVDGRRFTNAFPMFEYSSDFEAQLKACITSFAEIPTLDDDLMTKRFVRIEALKKHVWAVS